MHAPTLRRLTLAAALAALLSPFALAAPPPTVTATAVRGAVHVLVGPGGNVGVSAGPDGVLIVDDKLTDTTPAIRDALRPLGSDAPTFVLNTHWHADHTGGNPAFGKSAPIIAHDAVRARLATRQVLPRGTYEALPPEGLPDITFADALTMHFNGEAIRLRHFPSAHTDGDVVVWFTGSKVLHMGDIFFEGRFPFVDLDTGGSVLGVRAAVHAALEMVPADTVIIPGHGDVTDVDGLRAYLAMLDDTIGIVRARIAAGDDADAVVKKGLPAKYDGLSWGFVPTERWLRTIHASLTAERGGK